MQVEQIKFYRSEGGRVYARGFMNDVIRKNGGSSFNLAGMVEYNLDRSATYISTDAMCQLLDNSWATVPRTPFSEAELPTPRGFIVLEKPWLWRDYHGKQMVVKALSWFTVVLEADDERIANFEPPKRKGMFLVAYCDNNDPRDDYVTTDKERLLGFKERLSLGHFQAVPFNEEWNRFETSQEAKDWYNEPNPEAITYVMEFIARVKALFAFLQQELPVVFREAPPRQARRGYARQGLLAGIDDVQVVALRRKKPVGLPHTEPSGEEVNWSHRWIVRPHWREQWYPKLGIHQPVWIEAYEKGPEDKPLVVKTQVFDWRR